MINPENIPTPSPEEVRKIFSVEGGESESVADGLVYTALGLYEDNDYLGFARIATDLGAIDEIAKAEARLHIINEYDERNPGYEGQSLFEEQNRRREAGIEYIKQSLAQKDADRLTDMSVVEAAKLENEQLVAIIELPYI